ncbi:ferredoxin--NADP reductase [Hymenobacter jeollabukensis]|uniref:Ferredoxin--NADP reductase n=1 Tax=Hymenobacter jeollabukensis TaxID=2025313 RepID=A0A5R8WSR1_9BACT|nr:ferredoxin--NADP reductase [Hymenobacter jeollabukensis]TLM94221.1 ferredoxin--NADP reductase [Hymenobacter jeollabukensis]
MPSAASPYRPLRVLAVRAETDDTRTLVLAPADDRPLPYRAGQYLTLVQHEHGHEARRSYSLSSSPALPEPLAITVKRIANGLFSRQLVDRAQPGDVLLTTGAAGLFTLPDELTDVRQVWLLAAGSGITPVYSLLKTLLATQPQLPVVLVYSNHAPHTTIFRAELEALAARHPQQLRIEWLFSNAPDLARAHLYKELLESLVRQHAVAGPTELLAYMCGPLNYMRMCTYALRELQVPPARIRRENFVTEPASVPPLLPPDTEAHPVTVRWAGRQYEFESRHPDTILQAARRHDLRLPYSCEAGRCGNCVARCTQGRVWMSYNEVLTERDLAHGLVLTCTGYPVGGPIQLEIDG